MNYFELKNQYEKKFLENNIDETADIDWIMVEITGKKRSMLPFHNFSDNELELINEAINKRLNHIPIAYIFEKTEFFGRKFFVSRNTLIPRMDTEILIETIISNLKNQKKPVDILDIGTGSGIIAITLKKEINSNVTAVDISEEALIIARKNAEHLNTEIVFQKSNLFENIDKKKFDIIVSNPPYIKTGVIEELEPEVKENEPILALDGGIDGLKFYRDIISNSKSYLKMGGMIFFEIGFDQANEIIELMKNDFENIKVIKDYSNNDRVVFGKLRS